MLEGNQAESCSECSYPKNPLAEYCDSLRRLRRRVLPAHLRRDRRQLLAVRDGTMASVTKLAWVREVQYWRLGRSCSRTRPPERPRRPLAHLRAMAQKVVGDHARHHRL